VIFCDAALAERIERTEAARVATGAARHGDGSFVIPIAGGYATFAEPESPLNKVVGLGFAGTPSDTAWYEIEQAFAAGNTAVQVELSHLGDTTIGTHLTERGYRLTGFENVLGRTVDPEPTRVTPAGVEIRPSGDDELDLWLGIVVEAFTHPDTGRLVPAEEFPRGVLARAVRDLSSAVGVQRYLALCDGVPAGGASAAYAGGVAALTGAATLPAYRRRGIQTALLSVRLSDAAAAGCDVATVTTSPATKSQQNAQRQGFELLYTRAILVNGVHPVSDG